MGLCQEMAELSGMRCLLHSLAVGVSIMRVTEGCLCVGECFSTFCVCIPTVCVCAKCTISSVCQFSMMTKVATQVTAQMAATDVPKQHHGKTDRRYIHTQS